ncbi:MAG: oligopeptide transporter, OPT family [Sedimentisphaerales bacterium]|nr:oligopeptide transporter, OPT family [Sedimentisphaerales bacterium]
MDTKKEPLMEITVKAVVLGIVLSVVLGAANAYLGLFAGMTVSASIPAAVVSMGVLRLFQRSSILENNIVQTAASAGESLAAGVIFTLPALVIMGFWQEFDFFWVTIIAGFGGMLGVLFTIPLRRSLIVKDKLQFPEGVATAEVLQTGHEGGKSVTCIAQAAVVAGLYKLGAKGFGFWPEMVEGARRLSGSIAYFGTNLSPALLSVGYIVGLNIAALVFIGGAINWMIAIPICAGMNEWATYPEGHDLAGQMMSALDYAGYLWSAKTRYLGVGGMLLGGLWTIVQMRKSLLGGIRSGLLAWRKSAAGLEEIPRTEKDMPMKWVLILIMVSIVPLILVYQVFVKDLSVTLPMAVIMLLAGFVFSAVSAYMAGLVGSSNTPISGVTIATIVVASLFLVLLMGRGNTNGPAAAVIISSVVCCAAAIANDNMQDLKTGYLVKATPWKQQVMQIIGTLSSALVIAPVLMLLYKAYGFKGQAGAAPDALAAVQANLIASVAQGVFQGNLPWNFIYIGMLLAAGIIMLDGYLRSKNSSFRTPVLAVAIGIYLPFELSVPIFAGGLIHQAVQAFHRSKNLDKNQIEQSNRNGLLYASGLITGEALMGILLAIPILLLKRIDVTLPCWNSDTLLKDFLGFLNIDLPWQLPIGAILGLILLLIITYQLLKVGIVKE